ncbi:MAG: chemotaxis protein CheX [Rhizobacter sp.]|nr:chemotaxis protein CheX [Rhizobacter sp.]
MAALKESDLRLFVDSVSRYFDVTSRIAPEITSAFLGVGTLPSHDFNGIVSFSGRFIGHVIVSLPAAALKELLLIQRETDLSRANLLDAVGEIANTLAGNARKALGKDLEISVPTVVHGRSGSETRTRQHPYVITFRWNTYPGMVCVDLAEVA